MREELKPCPFCGSTNIGDSPIEASSPDDLISAFGCRDCGAIFECGSADDWNRRANQGDRP